MPPWTTRPISGTILGHQRPEDRFGPISRRARRVLDASSGRFDPSAPPLWPGTRGIPAFWDKRSVVPTRSQPTMSFQSYWQQQQQP